VIDAVSQETNFAYHATSNPEGEWTISLVRIGRYRVTVTAAGFSKAEIGLFTLGVQLSTTWLRSDVSLPRARHGKCNLGLKFYH
jgi:Carboxypeptidase regulatory-like domain